MGYYERISLKVTGKEAHMKEFYLQLKSNGSYDFTISKFLSKPLDLVEMQRYIDFEVYDRTESIDKSGNVQIKEIDKFGRTIDEHELYLSELKTKHGFIDIDEWCMDNWGFCETIPECTEFSVVVNKYIALYFSKGGANIEFIKYLHKRYPQLTFTMDLFHCSSSQYMRSVRLSPSGYEEFEKKSAIFGFSYNEKTGKHHFEEMVDNNFDLDISGELYDMNIPLLEDEDWERVIFEYFDSLDEIDNLEDLFNYLYQVFNPFNYIV